MLDESGPEFRTGRIARFNSDWRDPVRRQEGVRPDSRARRAGTFRRWNLDAQKHEIIRPVAFITGASSGLGAEFARAFAARHYDLVLVARRRERLNELARDLITGHGISVRVIVADLSLERDVEAIAQAIAGESRTEILVNNAGFGALGRFHQAPVETQMRMHRLHILATVRLCHAALQRLAARNRGGIINVSSVAGFSRVPGHTSYGSTKAWMLAFTECLHLELRSTGSAVQVQALCPGFTYTEFHDVLNLDRDKMMPYHSFWMTVGFVVAESLKAFDRRKWLVVPGWRYRLLTFLLTVVPRPLMHPLVMRVARMRESAAPRR